MPISEPDLLKALQGVLDPETGHDLVATKQLRNLRVSGSDVAFDVELGYPAKSLHEGHGVSKSLYDEAVKLVGERGIVEIIGLCGYYTMVSMTLNTFEFGLPEGQVSELV